MTTDTQQITVPQFTALKAAGQKITMLTAYDYPTAQLVDAAGVEGILVGDSLSMVVQGHPTTLPVTLEEMIYHAEIVGRAVRHALLVVDMPFPSFHLGVYKAIESAGRILKETRCQAVKLEGGVAPGGSDRGPGLGRHSRDGPLRLATAEHSPVWAAIACSATRSNCWPTPGRPSKPAPSPSSWSAFPPRWPTASPRP